MQYDEPLPTKLIRRKPETVSKSTYDELKSLYDEVLQLGYDLIDEIDERDEIIYQLETENIDLKDTIKRLSAKKKFSGMKLRLDPFHREFGFDLLFKSMC